MSMDIRGYEYISSPEFGRAMQTEDGKKWIRCKDAIDMYGLSRPTIVRLAREAGAAYKINKAILINTETFDVYLESFRVPGAIK